MRVTSSRSEPSPLGRDRRADDRVVTVSLRREVHRRRAGPARRCAAPVSPVRPAASCARRRTRPRCRRPGCPGRDSRQTTSLARNAREHGGRRRRARAGRPSCRATRGTTTNHSNSSGGSSGSTTTVIGRPWSAIQRPAHSHPPRWGRATMTPWPALSASSTCSKPFVRERRRRPRRRTGRAAGSSPPSSGRSSRTRSGPPAAGRALAAWGRPGAGGARSSCAAPRMPAPNPTPSDRRHERASPARAGSAPPATRRGTRAGRCGRTRDPGPWPWRRASASAGGDDGGRRSAPGAPSAATAAGSGGPPGAP